MKTDFKVLERFDKYEFNDLFNDVTYKAENAWKTNI